jgi:phage tail-like protein
MKPFEKTTQSKLLDYLPAIYHDQEFLNAYLSAFEKILIGQDVPGGEHGAESLSLEEKIDRIADLFDPRITPRDFLPWLASWAALTLRADLGEGEQRAFVANIIQRYRRRGTKDNLIELLRLFTQTTPEIDEDAAPSEFFKRRFPQFNSDERPLHFFKVSVLLTDPKPETVERKREIAQALIELEKPAHTFYELETKFSSMRIGNFSDKGKYRANLGVDTLINIWSNVSADELKNK